MPNEFDLEVDRRLDEIRSDPEHLMRYDIDGDGIISDHEWEEVRRFVQAEVATQHARNHQENQQDIQNPAENEQPLERLQDRFELMHIIGQGAQGKTYFGRDHQSNHNVAVKELQMNQLEAWQAIELFEREADVLKNISHPAIPRFIDFFHTEADDQNGMRSFLVQEFIDGENLKELMESGAPVDESTARAFLKEILNILDYLHTLPQPIIHSDIKLSNIIRRTDRRLILIDFGAVQFHANDTDSSSAIRPTIVGTAGYMPLEQMMGKSVPATDIYALAATTVHLLSRRHPADLPVIGMALQFEEFVNISPQLTQILNKMLAPHLEHRFVSVKEVLHALEQAPQKTPQKTRPQPTPPTALQTTPQTYQTAPRRNPTAIQFQKPAHMNRPLFAPMNPALTGPAPIKSPPVWKTEINHDDGQLSLNIPQAKSLKDIVLMLYALPFLTIGLVGTILFIVNHSQFDGLELVGGITIMLAFIAMPLAVVVSTYNKAFGRISIAIDDTTLHHHKKTLFGTKSTDIPLKAITAILLVPPLDSNMHHQIVSQSIEIQSHNEIVSLAQGLSLDEKNHLMSLIREQQTASRKKITP